MGRNKEVFDAVSGGGEGRNEHDVDDESLTRLGQRPCTRTCMPVHACTRHGGYPAFSRSAYNRVLCVGRGWKCSCGETRLEGIFIQCRL
jgi:hypothetical protein